jgi:SAM-dependent methyltransferase
VRNRESTQISRHAGTGDRLTEGGARSRLAPHLVVDFDTARKKFLAQADAVSPEEHLLRTLQSGSTIVSIGEGTGEYMLALAKRFPTLDFIGFDLDEERIRVAVQLCRSLGLTNARFDVADGCALPLPNGGADFLYVKNTLHVVPDQRKFLAEVRRVAKGSVRFSDIRNVWLAPIIARISAVVSACLGRRPYREFMAPHWSTERWLRKIGASHGPLWYLALVRSQFPNARLNMGTRVLAIEVWRPPNAQVTYEMQSLPRAIDTLSDASGESRR